MTELQPAMPLSGPPSPSTSVWVGECQDVALANRTSGQRITLAQGTGFQQARLLIRHGTAVRGFVVLPIDHTTARGTATISAADAADHVARLPHVADESTAPQASGTISVVIPTRDRPDHLRLALASILACADDDFEVVVADNGSRGTGTADVVAECADPRLRLVTEPVPGISRARNRGIRAASGAILAFTDDDVMVDPGWLTGLRRGFARGTDVGCVAGLVPAGELRTETQQWFESRVTWGRLVAPQIYRLASPPESHPLFPFELGRYGTGANMAVRTSTYWDLGGMDERLGVGTVTKGGEDLDFFLRVLLNGEAVVVEPSALIWHRHRAEREALATQVVGYGRGLGALLTKVLVTPSTRALAARKIPAGLRHLRTLISPKPTATDSAGSPDRTFSKAERSRLARKELLALLGGPGAFIKSWWNQRTIPPLAPVDRQSGQE